MSLEEKLTFVRLPSINILGIKLMLFMFCEIHGYSLKAFMSLLKSFKSHAYKFKGEVILSNVLPYDVFIIGLS